MCNGVCGIVPMTVCFFEFQHSCVHILFTLLSSPGKSVSPSGSGLTLKLLDTFLYQHIISPFLLCHLTLL